MFNSEIAKSGTVSYDYQQFLPFSIFLKNFPWFPLTTDHTLSLHNDETPWKTEQPHA